MRSGLVLLLLCLPGAALAAEDRYGPTRSPAVAPIVAATAAPVAVVAPTDYRGGLLSWAGKPAAGQPLAPVAAPPAPVPAPAVSPPPPPAFASRGPEPARLPTSLYDAPAAAAPVVRSPTPAPISPAPVPAAAPPQAVWPQAAAEPSLPPPPAAPPAAGAPVYAYSPPRAYSVVREWGGTPDRIPSPPRAEAFSGREVALDPNTLGAAQQPDPPPEDEVDEEQPPPKQPAPKQPGKAARK